MPWKWLGLYSLDILARSQKKNDTFFLFQHVVDANDNTSPLKMSKGLWCNPKTGKLTPTTLLRVQDNNVCMQLEGQFVFILSELQYVT